jgi:electron transfer flavoprotein alpha subunit
MSDILVILETRAGALRPASLEAVGAARTLAGDGSVIALAPESFDADAAVLGAAGADRVLIATRDTHSAESAAKTAARVAGETGASAVLLAATVRGRDLAPRIAALLQSGLAPDCVSVQTAGDKLECERPIFGGRAMTRVQVSGNTPVASLRPNHFAPAGRDGSTATVEEIAAEGAGGSVQEIKAAAGGRPDVAEASRVVAGGRGMGSAEAWAMLEAVADAIPGSALGASRAVVDSGWRPHSEQVGQTGKTVSPELYIAAGISGAIQHLAGMSSSKVIVAINKDADAPIFQHASYGIVGDVAEVLPALAEQLAALNA